MSRTLTPQSTLELLQKEAKRWLKALRAHDETARARLERATPKAPAEPTLRHVQHALAREHGLANWAALKNALAENEIAHRRHAERVAWFIENACPDHTVRGGPAHVRARQATEMILRRHPEVARDSIYTAIVCGDLAEVERILRERPQAACEPGGPKGWEPLLYLCFARVPLAAANDNAVAIARLLLDHGADPNAYFEGGGCRYTALVGVIGEGEEHRPPHPRREALTGLLLERGADPYDIQVLYNTHFRGDLLWLLELMYAQAVKSGRQSEWDDPNWPMLDMGGYGCGARYLLGLAVGRNDLALAEWLLAHGASPSEPPPSHPRASQRSLHEEAVRRGFAEMADLLVRFGATPSGVVLEGEDAFVAACLRLDREEVRTLLRQHPEYLHSPRAMMAAAERDRADVATLLLDLGMSPDVEDPQSGRTRPLHTAAYHGAARVAALLIERGAEIDPLDATHQGTPLWAAVWDQRPRTIELLSRVSHDAWSLALTGNIERLREVLIAEPGRANALRWGETPLFYLPGDETRAMEIVELLLAHGADPAHKNSEGMTAAECARKQGMEAVAERLSAEG